MEEGWSDLLAAAVGSRAAVQESALSWGCTLATQILTLHV